MYLYCSVLICNPENVEEPGGMDLYTINYINFELYLNYEMIQIIRTIFLIILLSICSSFKSCAVFTHFPTSVLYLVPVPQIFTLV